MFSARIVKAINVLEDGDLGGSACLPGMPPDQLCLDGFEEGFHRGVIISVGGARLLRCDLSFIGTTGLPYTHMLNDFCNGSMSGQFPYSKLTSKLPTHDAAWEMTRFVAKSRNVTKLLLDTVDVYLAKMGASEVITISPLHMPRILRRFKYDTRVISESVVYDDRAYVALSTSIRSNCELAARAN